jgi:glycosyltransferase involved in cell wall biosynthesis
MAECVSGNSVFTGNMKAELANPLEAWRVPKSTNLHVLTLTPFYPSEGDDANGCFVSEPLASLAKFGVANHVMAVQPVYRSRIRSRDSDFPAEWLRYFSLPRGFGLSTSGAFLFARIVGRVRALNHNQRIDLIHAHGPLPCGHAAMLLSKELNIPYVVSVHGLDVFSTVQVSGPPGAWCRRISQRVYAASRRVICISELVREEVLEGMGRSCRTSVVYNGVDPELFFPAAEPPRSTSPIILSVGNLIPVKGHELLVRAVASLSAEFPHLRCEIIGDGPERSRLEALAAELKIGDIVTFPGRQSRKQVAAAMRKCTLFALPSRYEGLGCVYLEAMSSGKPTIGCRGQGIGEIIRHGSNGFLVGPDNEKELTLAISMLLGDERLRNNLGRAARDTILEGLTLDHQAENLMRVYRESTS